jgi:hypothetical protein
MFFELLFDKFTDAGICRNFSVKTVEQLDIDCFKNDFFQVE